MIQTGGALVLHNELFSSLVPFARCNRSGDLMIRAELIALGTHDLLRPNWDPSSISTEGWLSVPLLNKGRLLAGCKTAPETCAALATMMQFDRMDGISDRRAEMEGRTREEVESEAISNEGLRQLGTPEGVAALVVFLCGPDARHIHGAGITIDGGGSKGYS